MRSRAVWSILRFWASADVYIENGPDILDALAEANRFNRWMADTMHRTSERTYSSWRRNGEPNPSSVAPRRKRYIATDIDARASGPAATRLQHRPNMRTAVCDLTMRP